MTDYFSPTVIQPAIPVADITPLERLLLSHIFHVEDGPGGLFFYEDEGPAAAIWLDRAPLEAALAQSPRLRSIPALLPISSSNSLNM